MNETTAPPLTFLLLRYCGVLISSLMYLTPAVTALLAWLLFGESLGWRACR